MSRGVVFQTIIWQGLCYLEGWYHEPNIFRWLGVSDTILYSNPDDDDDGDDGDDDDGDDDDGDDDDDDYDRYYCYYDGWWW